LFVELESGNAGLFMLCMLRYGNNQSALQEYQLVATFLATLSLPDILQALDWIQVQGTPAFLFYGMYLNLKGHSHGKIYEIPTLYLYGEGLK
jgi:hypothetical protein